MIDCDKCMIYIVVKVLKMTFQLFLFAICIGCGAHESNIASKDYSRYFNIEQLEQLAAPLSEGYLISMSSEPENKMSKYGKTYYHSGNDMKLYLLVYNCNTSDFNTKIKFMLNYNEEAVIFDGILQDVSTIKLKPKEYGIYQIIITGLDKNTSYDLLLINTFMDNNIPNADIFRYILTDTASVYRFPNIVFSNVESTPVSMGFPQGYTGYELYHKSLGNSVDVELLMRNNTVYNINNIILTFEGLTNVSQSAVKMQTATEYTLPLGSFNKSNIWAIVAENPFTPLEVDGVLQKQPVMTVSSFPQ